MSFNRFQGICAPAFNSRTKPHAPIGRNMSLTTESVVSSNTGDAISEKRNGKTITTLPSVTIRFAGDSGDGMQLAGTQFTDTSALVGNDISTLPDFPAEIRAPAGTLAGVS